MNITLDTQTMSEHEAAALVMSLAVLFPNVIAIMMQRAMLVDAAASSAKTELGVSFTTGSAEPATPPAKDRKKAEPVVSAPQHSTPTQTGEQINPADNPSAGADTAATVFTQGVAAAKIMTAKAGDVTYDAYISAGWNDEQLIAEGLLNPPAEPTPVAEQQINADPAKVFAGGANGPLVPTNGAQPAPASTSETPPPSSPDAATVFAAASATPAPSGVDASGVVPSTNVVQAEYDSDGLPWDHRIHASTKTKTATGKWKKGRNVDDGVYAQVVSELRNAVAANKAASFTPLDSASTAQVAPPPPGQVPPPPVNQAQQQTTGAEVKIDFVTCARFAGEHRIPAAKITEICNAHGLAGLAMLTGAPQLAPKVYAQLKAAAGVA